ncbi:MAG: tetratricopeptide repeat protein [Planctomycetes bacterium]|nr:tetratricopeptide repeat protein [Planctomycetota bacterium]MCW8137229.1 tetratricopeptide repeat protein [Planctomycetota bacterium]
MKPLPKPPIWLPGLLHLAHGLVAGGVGYMLAYAGTMWWASEPGSPRAALVLAAALALAVFEGAFFVFWIARRRRMRRLWREAAAALKREDYQSAQVHLLELAGFLEYRMAPQPVLFSLGVAHEGMGNEREALVLYRRCGDFAPALRAIGVLQLSRGLNDSAAEALRRLVARYPQDLSATIALTLALVRGGHAGAAEKVLLRALEKRPKSEMLKVNLQRVKEGKEPAFELDNRQSQPQ